MLTFFFYYLKNYIEQVSRKITPTAKLTNTFPPLILLLWKNVHFCLPGVNFATSLEAKAVLQQELCATWVSRALRKRSVVKVKGNII